MLQESLLFLSADDEEKNYNEELELSSGKASLLSNFSTTSTTCIVISILGLIGNGMVFWHLCCTNKKTKFIAYAANMAAGDILALFRSLISFLMFFLPRLNNTRMKQLMLIMFFFGHGSRSYFLAAMSTERCLSVFSPVWYQSHRQKCPTAFVIAFLWTLGIILKVLSHFFCSKIYTASLTIGASLCTFSTISSYTTVFVILFPSMVFSTLALLLRMNVKPQHDFPARLDISIWVTVALHVIFYPVPEIFGSILPYISFSYYVEFFNLALIFYCMDCSVSPFVYLLVGCWKWEKGQEPFNMFLERALKEETQGMMRAQPDQEQA